MEVKRLSDIENQLTRLRAKYEEVAAEYGVWMSSLPNMVQDPAVSASEFRRSFAEGNELASRLAELRRMMKLLLHNGGGTRPEWYRIDPLLSLDGSLDPEA